MYFKVFLLLVSFLMICIGGVLLFTEISTRITDYFKWCLYKEKAKGTVFSINKAELTSSYRFVEEKTEGHFSPIEETQDRNFAYPPFKPGIGDRQYYPIFQWKSEEREFRGHYPYLGPKDRWKAGDTIEVHYSARKPWNYAVKDTRMWRFACIHCIADLADIGAGIILIFNMIS